MSETEHILVVDDDDTMRKVLETYLVAEGYRVSMAADGEAMRSEMNREAADLVLMDLKLPGEDGLTLTRWLRENYKVGVIILTTKNATVDRVVGLEIGADDYVTKPFEERELLARIRSVMRRVAEARQSSDNRPAVVGFADWVLNLDARSLRDGDGSECELTSGEFALLSELVANAGKVLSRDRLLNAVYKRDWEPYDRSIDVLITRLRRKLEQDAKRPTLIKTVRGAGYTFVADVRRMGEGE